MPHSIATMGKGNADTRLGSVNFLTASWSIPGLSNEALSWEVLVNTPSSMETTPDRPGIGSTSVDGKLQTRQETHNPQGQDPLTRHEM